MVRSAISPNKYALWSALVFGALSVWILSPFVGPLIWSVPMAYILHYVYRIFNVALKSERASRIITIVLFLFVSISVLYVGATGIPSLSIAATQFASHLTENTEPVLRELVPSEELVTSILGALAGFESEAPRHVFSVLGSLPKIIIDVFVFIVATIFFFKDGAVIKHELFSLIKKMPAHERRLVNKMVITSDDLLRGVFLTYALSALIVGVLAFVGFSLLGIPFAWGWAILIGIAAFLPIIAAFMVYGPLALFYFVSGDVFTAVALAVYGVIVLNILPEVVFRPWLGTIHTKEHPLVLFVGFLAGPFVLGFEGVILGPLILLMFKRLLEYYTEDG